MAQHEMVLIRVLRKYPRGGVQYAPGSTIRVPDYAVPSIVDANPPFGEVLRGDGTGEATDPLSVVPLTDSARNLAEEAELTAADFAGRTPTGVGGFIKADVEAILAERETAADPETG